MQAEKLAYYPFISEASAHVGNLGISLESLLTSRAYRAARARGIERVKEALEGEIKKSPVSGELSPLNQQCVNLNIVRKRYLLQRIHFLVGRR